MNKRVSKNDMAFLGILFAVLLLVLLCCFLFRGSNGETVQITIDGEIYGTYSISEDQEIPIIINHRTTNVLKISDGKADMVEADCPDKLCIHQKAISKNNETIVCLPNKVVVTVISNKESEFDSVAK